MELQKYTHQHRGQPFDVALLYKNHAAQTTLHSSLDREHFISDLTYKISLRPALCTDLHVSLHLAEKIWSVADAMKPMQENSKNPLKI
jgi:hypothetical protein